jgi:adenylate cyclase
MASTRRLAAILAADVVGYSRLMGADEEGTLERLKALRRELIDLKITQHHGRIVKTTGDGMLVEFASVVNAVRCAAEVQRAMPERNSGVPVDNRIELRIGINLGDVIADGNDLYGDGVNIAARIEALADAGGVFVSGTVFDQVRDRLPFGFEDRGVQQVKNIARPIRVYRILLAEAASTAANKALPLPDKPSIAVLAFTNMSGDPEQEYFSDGIADDIITELSRSRSLFVIARNSSFTYRGRAIDVKEVGRELGVRYVLEGSARRGGNRVRVNAQLIDAETGSHVWAERYDRDLADVFVLQDEITLAVIGAVGPAVADAEQRRALRKPPESLGAWETYQRGMWHLSKFTAEDVPRARELFNRALELDPTLAVAHTGLAVLFNTEGAGHASRPLLEALRLSGQEAQKALELDPTDADALGFRAFAAGNLGHCAAGLDHAERALSINPNCARAHHAKGWLQIFTGQPAEGRRAILYGIRLDPRMASYPFVRNQIALSYYFENDYETTVAEAAGLIADHPKHPLAYRWLAAALGQLGRSDEARAALDKAIATAPDTFRLYVEQRVPWMRPADYDHMLDGLRKAGWQG